MKRVFIAWSHALFHRSIRALLDHPRLTIIGDSQSIDTVQMELVALQPDTIIVEVLEDEACADALNLVLGCHWNPRLICVSSQDNMVQIYRRQQIMLEESRDLLHLVLDD